MGAMVTGELKRQIDEVWNDFWSGGISNPLEVMEQLTYLLFIKGLDEQQALAENKANRTGKPIEDEIFSEGQEFRPEGRAEGRPYDDLRLVDVQEHARSRDVRHRRKLRVPVPSGSGRRKYACQAHA